MIRLLVRSCVLLLASTLGLLAANYFLDDMRMSLSSLLLDIVIFTVIQAVMAPFIAKVAARNATALLGGVGLISTFVALLVTTVVSDGLVIDGASTWLLASLIVWLVTMFATLLLPFLLVWLGVSSARERRAA